MNLSSWYMLHKEELSRVWYRFKNNKLSIVGLILLLLIFITAIFAPILAPYPEDSGKVVHFDRAHEPPSVEHPFGTDAVGRDLLSRVLFGSRLSLLLGTFVVTTAILMGIPLGLIAAYWGGIISTLIMRITDMFLSVPSLVLAIAITAVLGPNLTNAMIAMSFTWWPWFTRLVYGEALSRKEEEYVKASEALGASKVRIAFKVILPNCTSSILVKATIDMGLAILTGATLSFLGMGARPPTPDWGTMISTARSYLPYVWWPALFPGLAIFTTVLGFNLIGDGLRDVFDVEIM